ncbi:hypothetical protein L873DRAFT_1046971 [Choiromyces venosus 120613-1]|uniref:Uncharacterized protein n=1 Tax=Choiromyces venosus 120613-1 TaxID=1336337 RepID=A0A3N4JN72_9PEZI|nr:hypothetical protein L873DRAFT_1046971 [Choiromyces venosus 120613-1]
MHTYYSSITPHFSRAYIHQYPPIPLPMPAPIEPLQVDPVACNSAPSISSFAKLSALIPDENKLRYSTPLNLATDIEVKIEECHEPETGCYMLVTGVAEEMVGGIAEEMEELSIRRAA